MQAGSIAVAVAVMLLSAGAAHADWAMGKYWVDGVVPGTSYSVVNPSGAVGWPDGVMAVVPPSSEPLLGDQFPFPQVSQGALVLTYNRPIDTIGGGVTVNWVMGNEPVNATVWAGFVGYDNGLPMYMFGFIGAIQYVPPGWVEPGMGLGWPVRNTGLYQATFPLDEGFSANVIAIKNDMSLSVYVGNLMVDGVSGLISLGGNASSPQLPTISASAPGAFVFKDAKNNAWFDPPWTSEFTYSIEPGRLFTAIQQFPSGFGENMQVWIDGAPLADSLGTGDSVNFVTLLGHGVSSFVVKGIDPDGAATTVDAALGTAFPLKLALNVDYADVTMTATPEPATLSLLALGALAIMRRRGRK